MSAFQGALPEGFSYSEYARRGFFELCRLSILNLGLIWFMNRFSVQCGIEKNKTLRWFTVTLSAFTLVLIATAISKMTMYISQFGLTRLRLYTLWFMALLAIVFVFLILKQGKPNFKFCKACTAAFLISFTLLCFSDTDLIIAKYNIAMYETQKLEELDGSYLLELSDDAKMYVALNCDAKAVFGNEDFFQKRRDEEGQENFYEQANLSAFIANQTAESAYGKKK